VRRKGGGRERTEASVTCRRQRRGTYDRGDIVNNSQGLVLYYHANTRDEQIARESLSPAAVARREIMTTRHGRRQRRGRWWR
jgi:hypothetical protein